MKARYLQLYLNSPGHKRPRAPPPEATPTLLARGEEERAGGCVCVCVCVLCVYGVFSFVPARLELWINPEQSYAKCELLISIAHFI